MKEWRASWYKGLLENLYWAVFCLLHQAGPERDLCEGQRLPFDPPLFFLSCGHNLSLWIFALGPLPMDMSELGWLGGGCVAMFGCTPSLLRFNVFEVQIVVISPEKE